MKLDGSEIALQSAQMAFEQEQFERAQKVCSELLGLLEQNHVCKTFSRCIVLVSSKLPPPFHFDRSNPFNRHLFSNILRTF
ncbi:hypothetical protein PHET_10449 [Paragonimus heterotremus]|uniref:Uncharacterized protein n=1 Tax=Paragonimus heterotremus TaxID=100268 RepID=A0A8J4SS53_9TREM|nr:hypothetical protein PHET_10449 [Paragonimus heterotremus]